MEPLRLDRVLSFLEDAEWQLLAEVRRAAPEAIYANAPGRWSIAQILRHLVITEIVMYPLWTVVPRLRRWPRTRRSLDRANQWLWRAMGMRTVKPPQGKVKPENAADGRFVAPVFLRPFAGSGSLESLLAWRRRTRVRSLHAIRAVDEATLNELTWSHPVIGQYTLMEFVEFLGTHELHHLGQVRALAKR